MLQIVCIKDNFHLIQINETPYKLAEIYRDTWTVLYRLPKNTYNNQKTLDMENYFENHQWRGHFFNNFIKELDYHSYLELGVRDGNNCFNLIECDSKIGVDSNPSINLPGVVCSTTDDYFDNLDLNIKFDLIYIDAFHEKTQVYRDFCNSINHLNKGGIIILHDIFPLSKEYTSQSLNGTAYEFWIDLVKNYPENTHSFIGFPGNAEGTVGIYLNTNDKFDPHKITEFNYSYEYFFNNLPKYIYHKTITEDQIILKAKCW